MTRRFIAVLFALVIGHWSLVIGRDDAPPLAKQVTIYRDTYWVPHIVGKTDAACAFGLGYAQAEDNLPRIAQTVREATGTLSELEGEAALERDALVRRLKIPQFARENYHKIPADFQAVLKGYCEGVNFYVRRHPDKAPTVWRDLTPHDLVAAGRYIIIATFLANPLNARRLIAEQEGIGSNMWAVAPKKSANGKAMLFINPHLPWDGLVQWYEAHLLSDEGWNIMGATFFGSPFIGLGHNEHLGWSHTVNAPDTWDVYRVELNPDNPRQYRYEGAWRDMTVVTEVLCVKRGETTENLTCGLDYTHHGPVIHRTKTHAYAFKIAGWDDVLMMAQWYRMGKARSLKEFQAALRMQAVPMFNCVYADREGNIFYVYNGKVARKNEKFNWRGIVDGGTKETEWGNYLKFDELPQVLNPKAGFVQNCNTTPFETTAGDDNPKPEKFPRYLVGEGMNPRAQRARQVLEGKEKFTVEEFRSLPWDDYVLLADRMVSDLVSAFRALPEEKQKEDADVAKAVELLAQWDRKASRDSVAMPVFDRWAELYAARAKQPYKETDPTGRSLTLPKGIGEPETAMDCLRDAVADLKKWFGAFPVTWGEVHRIRRGDKEFATCGGDGGRYGMLHIIGSRRESNGRRYGTGGHSYVMVVAFTNPPQAWSIFAYGHNRTDPQSPYYADQTELFANAQFKPAWFTMDEIRAHLKKQYRPGE